MEIIRDRKYLNSLDVILDFIARDSLNKSLNFLSALDKKINTLPNMPFKFRQSFYYSDESVRDLIFKRYTIPYLVDIDNQFIVILDIFKWLDK